MGNIQDEFEPELNPEFFEEDVEAYDKHALDEDLDWEDS